MESAAPDPAGELLEAVKTGDLGQVERRLEASPGLLSARTPEGTSAILLALYYQRPAIAEAFVRRGAILDIFDASALGDAARVRALLAEEPARANGFAPDGFFPLGLAAFFGHAQAVRALLAGGADPNTTARNSTRVRAVHAAAAAHDAGILRCLLEAGADPNAVQQVGFVPLHEAASNGDAEMARLLVAHGARTDAVSDDGKTAAGHARGKGHDELAGWLDSSAGECPPLPQDRSSGTDSR
jgi:ankyrin repeat protein